MKKIDVLVILLPVCEESSDTSAQSPTKGYSPTYSQGWDRIFGGKKEKDTRAN